MLYHTHIFLRLHENKTRCHDMNMYNIFKWKVWTGLLILSPLLITCLSYWCACINHNRDYNKNQAERTFYPFQFFVLTLNWKRAKQCTCIFWFSEMSPNSGCIFWACGCVCVCVCVLLCVVACVCVCVCVCGCVEVQDIKAGSYPSS